ncbi:hypothetical protein R1sor_010503 [Riccia sorocarpa]|uniref:Uncharacterized protein n=1 Tax=Riccia sorocarpa TaxID=122646 RepID=A0ABD3I0Z5_9MARC
MEDREEGLTFEEGKVEEEEEVGYQQKRRIHHRPGENRPPSEGEGTQGEGGHLFLDIVPCLSVGDDDDSNPVIDNVKMDVEQTAKKTPIKDVLGFLVHKLEDAILPDDYTHVGVTLALDFSKSPRLKQSGKWIDLNNVENLHKYHNLEG